MLHHIRILTLRY